MLSLADNYFQTRIYPFLQEHHPSLLEKGISYGLVGRGSECYEFNDEISLDHDSEVRIIGWLPNSQIYGYAQSVQKEIEDYIRDANIRIEWVIDKDFIFRFIGTTHLPKTNEEWLSLPLDGLSSLTNGKVFLDGKGFFSQARSFFIDGFPKDVQFFLLARQLVYLGQYGQYNLPRMLMRQDKVTANLISGKFIETLLIIYHLIFNKYAPFYKWLWASTQKLPLPISVYNHISYFNEISIEEKPYYISVLVEDLFQNLQSMQFPMRRGEPLNCIEMAEQIKSVIQDPNLKQYNLWYRWK